MFDEFEQQVANALSQGDTRMNNLADEITVVKLEQAESRRLLKENTDATNAIKADTAELLEAFRSFKGAMKVLEWIGRAAKPIGYIAGTAITFTSVLLLAALMAVMASGLLSSMPTRIRLAPVAWAIRRMPVTIWLARSRIRRSSQVR